MGLKLIPTTSGISLRKSSPWVTPKRALTVQQQHRDKLDKLAAALLEQETLGEEEITAILD